jgi:iron complex transport system substrate-binding protein
LVSLQPDALADVWTDIERVALALDAFPAGADLIARLKARLIAITDRAKLLPDRPRVACIEWVDPLMAAGNWVPELVELAGGVNLFGEAGKHAPWMTWEQLLEADPDVMVLMPCGFDIRRTMEDVPFLQSKEGWQSLKAVRQGRVYSTDGNQYFNRPGPRLVESLEILAEVLHPKSFTFGHQGTGWQRV